MKSNNLLFYASVKNTSSFITSSFYANDIKALSSIGYNVRVTNKITPFFAFWRYDISFLYFYKKSLIPALVSRIFNKYIFFTGGIDELCLNVSINKFQLIRQKILFKFCYLLSNKCNIVSNSDMKNTIELLSRKPIFNIDKLSFFPHCIDLENYNSNLINTKENILLTICWMGSVDNVKRKGVDRCIYFLKELVNKNPSYKLILIGSLGEGTIFLKKIILEQKLQEFVIFTGEISEPKKIEYLRKAKYYLQYSIYEGFGMAVIEAMLYNCYVIHSNVGGLRDTIGENGLIIQNFDNYSNFVNNFILIDLNYSKLEQKINENRDLILEKYSIFSRSNYFKITFI